MVTSEKSPTKSKIPAPKKRTKILKAGDVSSQASATSPPEDVNTESTQNSCDSLESRSPSLVTFKKQLLEHSCTCELYSDLLKQVVKAQPDAELRIKNLEIEEIQREHNQLLEKHAKALKDIESYKIIVRDLRDVRAAEREKLQNEIAELKEQLSVDTCAFALMNVLRENGDNIVVAERDARELVKGLKDMLLRSEAIFLHISCIAQDFCQKLDDAEAGFRKRGLTITPTLPSPHEMSSVGTLMEEKEFLEHKLSETERLLEEAQAKAAQMKESVDGMADRIHELSERSHNESSLLAPQSEILAAIQGFQKDQTKQLITLSVRQGSIKPEEAYHQLKESDALGDLTYEDLKIMAPKKKIQLKKVFSRVFRSKKKTGNEPASPSDRQPLRFGEPPGELSLHEESNLEEQSHVEAV